LRDITQLRGSTTFRSRKSENVHFLARGGGALGGNERLKGGKKKGSSGGNLEEKRKEMRIFLTLPFSNLGTGLSRAAKKGKKNLPLYIASKSKKRD